MTRLPILTAALLLATSAVSDDILIVPTTPIEIRLRVVDAETFAQLRGEQHDALALAWPDRTPCEIVLPEGWPIKFYPKNKSAWWIDKQLGDRIAHEILHCLIVRWHQ